MTDRPPITQDGASVVISGDALPLLYRATLALIARRHRDGLAASPLLQQAHTTPGGAREWAWDPCEPWDGRPPDARQQAYVDKALAGEADKVAKTARGGRNDALFRSALKLGSYIAGAGCDEQMAIAALEAAAEANGYTAAAG